nr:Trp biosynthesis-associated membrane protein [Motilibacter deserti]
MAAVVAAGAVALLSGGRTWATARAVGTPVAAPPVPLTAGDLAPAVSALGLVALAGAAGLLAARGPLRRLVAVLVLLSGAGLAVVAGRAGTSESAAAREASESLPGGTSIGVAFSAWPWVAVVAGLVLAAAGFVAVARSGRWAALGARYDAPDGGRRAAPKDAWAALDRGEDPTD